METDGLFAIGSGAMTYVLIIIYTTLGGTQIKFHDFSSKEACEMAVTHAKKVYDRAKIECVPK